MDNAQGHVTVLAGGGAAAKFVLGLVQVSPEERVHVICNVGDDCEMWGLYVCPDIDRILHTLAGELDPYRDPETSGETYNCLNRIRKLGMPSWLRISDRDMATQLVRTELLRSGKRLDQATLELADLFGLGSIIIPATNDAVRSRIRSGDQVLGLREYMSRNGHGGETQAVIYEDSSAASPAAGVVESINAASRVILAPGDPVAHIGPILSVPGIREALIQTQAQVIAISPVVGSTALGAPSGSLTTPPLALSARSVAEGYRDFLDHMVLHTSDLGQLEALEALGIGVSVENILIGTGEDGERLAGRMLSEDRFGAKKGR